MASDQADFGNFFVLNSESSDAIGSGDQVDPLGVQGRLQIDHRGLCRSVRMGMEHTCQSPPKRFGMIQGCEVLVGINGVGDRRGIHIRHRIGEAHSTGSVGGDQPTALVGGAVGRMDQDRDANLVRKMKRLGQRFRRADSPGRSQRGPVASPDPSMPDTRDRARQPRS